MMLRTSPRRATARPGFTLVEMLMVVAIITLLLAITTVGLQKATDAQKNRSSKEQVYKLQQSIDAEYQRVVQQSADDARGGKVPQAVKDYCDNDVNRITAVWTAMQLRRQFPDSFAEAVTPFTVIPGYSLNPLATFAGVVGLGSASGANAPVDPNESAALLRLILAEKSTSGGGAMASSADELGQQMTVTIGGKPFKAFADAFGMPIGFRRWYGVKNGEDDVQAAPFVDANNPIKDPLDTRALVFNWTTGGQPNTTKRQQMQALGFVGRNRTATVYSLGKNKAPDLITGAPEGDDIVGHMLRRFWKQ